MFNPFKKPQLPPKSICNASKREREEYWRRFESYNRMKKCIQRGAIALSLIISILSLIISLR
jgi:hypothetical protein